MIFDSYSPLNVENIKCGIKILAACWGICGVDDISSFEFYESPERIYIYIGCFIALLMCVLKDEKNISRMLSCLTDTKHREGKRNS
jgi:hypothetical protein